MKMRLTFIVLLPLLLLLTPALAAANECPDQYLPEKEKTITIDVRNTGDVWIENVKLRVDIGKLKLKVYNSLEFHDQTIYKNFGCMIVVVMMINAAMEESDWLNLSSD